MTKKNGADDAKDDGEMGLRWLTCQKMAQITKDSAKKKTTRNGADDKRWR